MTRIAVIDKEKCSPAKCQNLCLKLCPRNRTGEECIIIGEDGKPEIDETICAGCGICSNRCPFEAIHIINLPEELKKDPIHQYGKNGFRLYNLPIPIFGKVVGILGQNGIGKSTAIKIISGMLKPNMGDLSKKEHDVNELIKFFKGTEAQIFFEKVKNKEITIAYKPQSVDLIPRTFKGNVKELLKKVDERNKIDEITKKLGIEKILESDISKISGGELQRVAIAACVLKKANLYVFDEPTSYLDVKQRIVVSKFIRELADENTALIVVEHDLIILDYIADLINVMYGQESCYGVVSLPKSAKAGINIYLEGYLKEENMRFRNNKIKFETSTPAKMTNENVLTSWENIEKNLGKFKLKADKGNIYKKAIIGVLGENAIGKTSFVKILAGVIKQDKGEIKEKIKVSYKPQYINTNSDEIVASVLKDAIIGYNTQIIRPLNLKQLLTKKVNELSGGELQRVAIAACLSKKAELYLLDEPSAYLDVEQRLILSKVIKELAEREGKTMLIVDHDVLFIDYLSDELIVFEGEPAVNGIVNGPFAMAEGMNKFLKGLDMTFRRDPESHRPRANKLDSQMDQKQKKKNKFYYV
jgi:ATP-binding cassette subfamily E protein 1